jgi:murein DD-endopeptidase MepM/ murein hydrolase activator NlpD
MDSLRGVGGLVAFVILVTACEVVDRDASKKTATDTSRGTIATDSSPVTATAATRTDNAAGDSVAGGDVQVSPESPTVGDAIFALGEGLSLTRPKCIWKGQPLPCHRLGDDVLAVIPSSAEDTAETDSLVFERPGGRIAKPITLGERRFGREIVLLDQRLTALVRQRDLIARDARAVLATVSEETTERFWSGPWHDPIEGAKSAGYGVERFYYPSRDSTRAISLDSTGKTHGSFGVDTSTVELKDVPSWRHTGIDIAAPRGTPVKAPAAGRVAGIGRYVLTGRTLLIDHGQGVFSAYFHLDSVLVKKGAEIEPGQEIGRVGSSGLATGPHLHFGIYIHGRDVDPGSWMRMPEWARTEPNATTPADSAKK